MSTNSYLREQATKAYLKSLPADSNIHYSRDEDMPWFLRMRLVLFWWCRACIYLSLWSMLQLDNIIVILLFNIDTSRTFLRWFLPTRNLRLASLYYSAGDIASTTTLATLTFLYELKSRISVVNTSVLLCSISFTDNNNNIFIQLILFNSIKIPYWNFLFFRTVIFP